MCLQMFKISLVPVPVSVMRIGSCSGMSGSSISGFGARLMDRRGFLGDASLKCDCIWLFLCPDVLNFLSQCGQSNGLAPDYENNFKN